MGSRARGVQARASWTHVRHLHLPRRARHVRAVGPLAQRAVVFARDLVGIPYLGHGQFVHAPHKGTRVTVANLGDPWFSRGYESAQRVIQESAVVSGA